MLTPILGALSLATGTILERMVLMKKSIEVKQFEFLEFLAIILVMTPFVFIFWNVEFSAFSLKNILILLGVVALSMLANYFTFTSVKKQNISKLEPAKMMEPLFVIFLTIFFSFAIGPLYERNFHAVIPALIAGVALIFSHLEKHHLKFGKYFNYAILGSFFFAAELTISRLILDYYSSLSFYFIRSILVLILVMVFFKPKFLTGVDKISRVKILITGAIWVVFRIIIYTGYKSIGIIETTLMIMLGPVFIYFFAWKFLKEKPTWKNLVASGIIILCVIYTTLI